MDYKGKKCLIAYFSHAGMNYVSGKIVNLKVGNTEQAAKMIGRMTGGDLFRHGLRQGQQATNTGRWRLDPPLPWTTATDPA